MKKVGQGKSKSREVTLKDYQESLEKSSHKFLKALEEFERSSPRERERLKAVMKEHLLLIRSASDEIKRFGVHKQDVLVEKDYEQYMKETTLENYIALKHDINTLRAYLDPL